MKKTPLVISFGGTLRSMVRGVVTPSDLENAIFYLGCAEVHAKSEDGALVEMENDLADERRCRALYRQFRTALDQAEGQGRVAWREPEGSKRWQQLNDLLATNNLPPIVPVDNDWPGEGRYSYPAVTQAIHDQNLPYEVIWNRR